MKKVLIVFIILSTFLFSMCSVLAAETKGTDGSGSGSGTMNRSGWHPDDNQGIVSKGRCPLFGDPQDPDEFAYYLQVAFDVIKFLGPALVIIVTIIDLLRITAEQKQDGELKKIGVKSLKRIIYAAIIFVLPGILTWFFQLMGLFGPCVS